MSNGNGIGSFEKGTLVEDGEKAGAGVEPQGREERSYDGQEMKDSEAIVAVKTFDDMHLREELLRGIYAHGFEKPSVIQQKAIVPLAGGHEVLAQAQSGTGKTGAYVIGMLQRVDPARAGTQLLVLTPTRELAAQVGEVASALGQHMHVRVHVCTGGTDVRRDHAALRSGPHVVVGTPGRVQDVLRRGALGTSAVRMLVLDEADEMLSFGFRDALHDICRALPRDLQCAVFSATYTPEAMAMARALMHAPLLIVIKAEEVSLAGITHYFVDVQEHAHKLPCIVDLFESISVAQSVIFCNSRRVVEQTTAVLRAEQWPVTMTHSGLDNHERTQLVRDFREGRTRLLLTTDLLARGLDVQGVQLVLNFDLPNEPETYLHRVGRAGRFGRNGVAISFVTRRDHQLLHQLEHVYATRLQPLPADIASIIAFK